MCEKEHFVVSELNSLIETFKKKTVKYGNSYKEFGKIAVALFPNGIELNSIEDFNRFGVLNMMISKLARYAANFNEGGHYDSLHDLSVYSTMLNDLDQNKEQKNEQ